jgi:hypothetical protein
VSCIYFSACEIVQKVTLHPMRASTSMLPLLLEIKGSEIFSTNAKNW